MLRSGQIQIKMENRQKKEEEEEEVDHKTTAHKVAYSIIMVNSSFTTMFINTTFQAMQEFTSMSATKNHH